MATQPKQAVFLKNCLIATDTNPIKHKLGTGDWNTKLERINKKITKKWNFAVKQKYLFSVQLDHSTIIIKKDDAQKLESVLSKMPPTITLNIIAPPSTTDNDDDSKQREEEHGHTLLFIYEKNQFEYKLAQRFDADDEFLFQSIMKAVEIQFELNGSIEILDEDECEVVCMDDIQTGLEGGEIGDALYLHIKFTPNTYAASKEASPVIVISEKEENVIRSLEITFDELMIHESKFERLKDEYSKSIETFQKKKETKIKNIACQIQDFFKQLIDDMTVNKPLQNTTVIQILSEYPGLVACERKKLNKAMIDIDTIIQSSLDQSRDERMQSVLCIGHTADTEFSETRHVLQSMHSSLEQIIDSLNQFDGEFDSAMIDVMEALKRQLIEAGMNEECWDKEGAPTTNQSPPDRDYYSIQIIALKQALQEKERRISQLEVERNHRNDMYRKHRSELSNRGRWKKNDSYRGSPPPYRRNYSRATRNGRRRESRQMPKRFDLKEESVDNMCCYNCGDVGHKWRKCPAYQ